MIIGGIGGVWRTGASRTGYKEAYLPVMVPVRPAALDAELNRNTPVEYRARLECINESDEWVHIVDCTYMQVSSNVNGGGTANLVIRNTPRWSVDSVENENLLRPSDRLIRIVCDMVVGLDTYSAPVFMGQVTHYSEVHGQSDGAISITARSTSSGAANRTPKGFERKTIYRIINDEAAASGLFPEFMAPVLFVFDRARTAPAASNLMELFERAASVSIDVLTRPSGGLVIRQRGTPVVSAAEFSLTDNNQTSIMRVLGRGTSYNTVLVVGRLLGVVTSAIVQDDEDVARRGTVRSPESYGSRWDALEENIIGAQAWISEMVRGAYSVQTQLNPFISAGSLVFLSSSRLSLDSEEARAGAVTHRLGDSAAETTLSNVAVIG